MGSQVHASQRVYDLICKRIREREWVPGDRIATEHELAQELGVSRMAVRQAVDRLEAMSVLRKRQGSGTYVRTYDPMLFFSAPVSDLSDADLIHLVEFRSGFDASNVYLFLMHAEEGDFAALETTYRDMVNHQDEPESYYPCCFAYYNIIAKGTRNPFAAKISSYFTDLQMQHLQRLAQLIGPLQALGSYALIHKCLRERDGDTAAALMRRHRRLLVERMRENAATLAPPPPAEPYAPPGPAAEIPAPDGEAPPEKKEFSAPARGESRIF